MLVPAVISYLVAPMPCLLRIKPRIFFVSSVIPVDDDLGAAGRLCVLIFSNHTKNTRIIFIDSLKIQQRLREDQIQFTSSLVSWK